MNSEHSHAPLIVNTPSLRPQKVFNIARNYPNIYVAWVPLVVSSPGNKQPSYNPAKKKHLSSNKEMHLQRGVSRAIQPTVHDFDQQTIGRHSPQTVAFAEEVIVIQNTMTFGVRPP